eukprot:g9003.t1
MGLNRIPKPVLGSVGLVRLDLACNDLRSVPAAISSLVNLEHLWLQGNPLTSVHPDIQQCTRLKIDLRGAPLKAKMRFFQRNTKGLMEYLRERDARKHIKVELYNKLSTGLYREVLDSPTGRFIQPLIKAVCLAFTDLQELTQVARHCDRLFPPDLAAAGLSDPVVVAAKLREEFTILGRKNERKRLASQLELKMRAIYYDVIDPAAVEGYIASIYEEVELLEDIQFLVRHAGVIMPTNPEEITGPRVASSMLALQTEMTNARQRCVDGLFEALSQIYNDQESPSVLSLTKKVAAVFAKGNRFADGAELEELKQLRADAQRVFPAEIREAEPIRIRTVFLAQRREQLGE